MKNIVVLSLSLLALGCSSNNREVATESTGMAGSYVMDKASPPAVNEPVADNTLPTTPIERKLIVMGNVRFRTGDLKKTNEEVLKLVEKYKGYIASQNESNSEYSIDQTIEVRIPSKDFTTFLKEIDKQSEHFDHKNINTQDVTEEYIDVEARIKTKKELEARYLEILKKANSVKEMMEVEAQLNQVRAEIESIEGRLKYLQNQTSFSTLTINFYQLTTKFQGFGYRFGEEVKQGWNGFIGFLLVLVRLWPFLFIVLPIVVLVMKWWRKRKLKKAGN